MLRLHLVLGWAAIALACSSAKGCERAASQAPQAWPCTFQAPEGWAEEAPPPVAAKRLVEPAGRGGVVRAALTFRGPQPTPWVETLARARAQEASELGDRLNFELARDHLLAGEMPGHLLVYRYRLGPREPIRLRYHAVFDAGGQSIEAIAEDQAIPLDALRLGRREGGRYELGLMRAFTSLRCDTARFSPAGHG